MVITSLENLTIKKYLKLKLKKYRDLDKLYLVEGYHLVNEALKSNLLIDLLVLENIEINIDFPYKYVTKEIMKNLSNLETISNIIGVVSIKNEDKIIGNRILLLDDIQDPGNLGTIIRTSVAFNVSTIVLGLKTVDLYNDKVIRSTQGMIYKVNIIRKDLENVIKTLKNNNYLILGTNVKNGIDVRKIKNDKFALIVGNEGNGVNFKLQELCDKNININMNPLCESLNVGVATSILLYELNRNLK